VLLYFAFYAVAPEMPGGVVTQGARGGATPVNYVGLGGEATVRIWFEAREDVEGVKFTLELPPGVRMVQDGKVVESPSLTWEGSLKAGRNLIPLRVRGVASGQWTVTASVEKDGSRKERSYDLRVDGA